MSITRLLARSRIALSSLLRPRRSELELEAELRDHLEQEIQNNIRMGMSPEEAKFAAQRLMGSAALFKEECRDARGLVHLETLLRDLRHAARMLRRTPLFTAVAVVTLAVGIGTNTAVFTFVENIVLRSLPIRDPQQVDALNWGQLANMSFPNYLDLRDRNNTFSDLVAYRFVSANLSLQPRENFRAWGYEATGNYFQALGVQPLLGRFFTPEDDDKPGAHPVIVISHHFWQTHLASVPDVVGRTIKINGFPFTVIGVAAHSFIGTEMIVGADYWAPMSMELQIEPGFGWTRWRTSQNAWVLGRRKPGVSRTQAEANLNQIGSQIGREHPDEVARKDTFHLSRPGLIGQSLRGPVTNFSLVLMGVTALGLLLACVNLAGMLLARASSRRREIGIRLALGGSRRQVLRHLMTESLLLASIGGLLGFTIAFAACRLLSAWHPAFDIPLNVALHPNPVVLCFTIAIVFLTTILFGLTPALQTIRVDIIPSLKNEPVSVHFRRWSVRDFLVTGQIALSVMLVICSVLVVRSLQQALSLHLGFNPTNAASVSFDLGLRDYTEQSIRNLQTTLLAKTSALPGIQSAAVINTLPLRLDGTDGEFFWHAERPIPPPSERRVALLYNISPGYFRTAETTLLSGRDFTQHDRAESPPVAIVNETVARLLFPKQNPLGKYIRISSLSRPMMIVGIVEDGKYRSLGEDTFPAVFVPILQAGNHWTTLVARSSLPAQTVVSLLRKAVLDLDPEIALFNTGSLKDQLALPLLGAQVAAIVLGTLGIFAMTQAAIGLFALMSYAVSRRTREIGIRMALGARRAHVLSSVLGRTLLLSGIGVSIGALATLGASRLLSAVLYGVSPRDPATYLAALSLMFAVALLACWAPANRAIHTDPVCALREE